MKSRSARPSRALAHRLRRVGIYCDANAWVDPARAFARTVCTLVQERLYRQGREGVVFNDPRPDEDVQHIFPPLKRAIQAHEVEAVIMLVASRSRLTWASRLPVPTAFLGGNEPASVNFDERRLVEMGLQNLKKQGCRSAGIICVLPEGNGEFYRHFHEVAAQLGLEVRREWVRSPDVEDCGGGLQESFGYNEFHAFWELRPRPQGLIVYTDISVQGVITAALELKVQVPRDLKLVLHRNAENKQPCPFPATFLDSSCKEVAQALIHQVERRFHGKACTPVWLKHRRAAWKTSRDETGERKDEG